MMEARSIMQKVKNCLRLSARDLRRKGTIGVLAILSLSSFFVYLALWQSPMFHALHMEYESMQEWAVELHLARLYPLKSGFLEEEIEEIENIEGVEWVVYPGGIFAYDVITCEGRNYTALIMWCNVEASTPPLFRFLIKGSFFGESNEPSVVVDSVAIASLKKAGIDIDLGTKLKMFGRNMTIIGIIGNPLLLGNEESYLKRSSVVFFYVPLRLYAEMVPLAESAEYAQTSWVDYTAYVKLNNRGLIDNVVEEIEEKISGVEIDTVIDHEQRLSQMSFMTYQIPAIVCYLIAGLVMIWDARFRRQHISTFRALGWRRIDVLRYFSIRNIVLGATSGFVGWLGSVIFVVVLLELLNLYVSTLAFFELGFGLATSIFVTFLFSIPSIAISYKTGLELR